MAELPHLGTRCAKKECRQLDFLPFTCDACGMKYCLEHRSYVAHSCQHAEGRETDIILCPICAKAIKLGGFHSDVNLDWEDHVVSGRCDPSNYARVHEKKRCGAPGCKEKLVFSNTFVCRACSMEVCLKHRFGSDHACPETSKSKPGGLFGGFKSSINGGTSGSKKPFGHRKDKDGSRPRQRSSIASKQAGDHSCSECDKCFKTAHDLNRHIEKKHVKAVKRDCIIV